MKLDGWQSVAVKTGKDRFGSLASIQPISAWPPKGDIQDLAVGWPAEAPCRAHRRRSVRKIGDNILNGNSPLGPLSRWWEQTAGGISVCVEIIDGN